MELVEMSPRDVELILRHTPKDLQKLLMDYASRLFLAGGALRSIIMGQSPKDFDFFGEQSTVKDAHTTLTKWRNAQAETARRRLPFTHVTDNALTLIGDADVPVQFITKWSFATPGELAKEFDFTVAKALLVYGGLNVPDYTSSSISLRKIEYRWMGLVDPNFYSDLAAKRLVYTGGGTPGGSVLRMVKLLRRGFNIQVESLAKLLAMVDAEADGRLGALGIEKSEQSFRQLLREVDPLPFGLVRVKNNG